MAKSAKQKHAPAQPMEKAIQCHKAGRFQEAEALYRAVLQQEPHRADALHLLGILMHQIGKNKLAYDFIQQAVQHEPANPVFHYSLGNVLHFLQKPEEAVSAYREALARNPNYVDAYNNLGKVLKDLKRLDEAAAAFHQAIALDPNSVIAYNSLGVLLREQEQYQEALSCYQKALVIHPNAAETLNNMGNVYKDLDRIEEAMGCYRQAIDADPNYAFAYNGLAVAYLEQKDSKNAIACYQKAINLKPDYAEAHSNLGKVLMEQGEMEASRFHLERAMILRPHLADSYYNLGTLLAKDRKLEESITLFDRALALNPNHNEVRWNRSLMLLAKGDYTAGWAEYDARLQLKEFPRRPLNKPMWDGAPLAGKRILVLPEQGFGDTFQFLRYLPLVKERGGHVIFECLPHVRSLLTHCQGVDELVLLKDSMAAPSVDHDCYIYLLSLPHLFQTTLETIPTVNRCLTIEPSLAAHWQNRLANDKKMNIGIVWACHSANETWHIRSTVLSNFLPLAERPQVTLYSLQKDADPNELDLPKHQGRIVNLASDIRDFADTAAMIQNLDLVITVDTAVAHLAGLLKKPTWVLIPYEYDWRWLRERTDSPWYPTLRLFRQPRRGDWESVFGQVAAALDAILT